MIDNVRSKLKILMFGSMDARIGDDQLSTLKYREGEPLLALLVLLHGKMAENQFLANKIWPSTSSVDSLRQSLSHLRKVLAAESERLCVNKGYIYLNMEGAYSDVINFDKSIQVSDIPSLEAAVSLYKSPLLLGWKEAWVKKEREDRHSQYLDSLKKLSNHFLKINNYSKAVIYLRKLAQNLPSEEQIWHILMETLVKCNERIEAIDVYRMYRDYLIREYKIAPPAKMTELYEKIYHVTPTIAKAKASSFTVPDSTGGAIGLDSQYYIERPIDQAARAVLTRGDSIVLIKGPRQTGKTSLLARSLESVRKANCRYAFTDLLKFSTSQLETIETFYLAAGQSIADQLNLEVQPHENWSKLRGANENFERYLRKEVLMKSESHFVWIIDDVDILFPHTFGTEIFSLIRSWHNERALDPNGELFKLTVAVAYTTEAFLFITDINQSPFNVGTRMNISDFSLSEVAELNDRYFQPVLYSQLEEFYEMIGGNPYLVNRGLSEMAKNNIPLDKFLILAEKETEFYGDHLTRMRHALIQDSELTVSVRMLLRGQSMKSLSDFYRLKSAGIITGDDPKSAKMRCILYRNYLAAHLS